MILVDSSVLIAGARPRDASHARAAAALEAVGEERLCLPVTILAETMGYLLRRDGIHGQRVFWDGFADSGIVTLAVDDGLIDMARDIDRRYSDVGFGFADSVLLATCEKQRCARVLSFDGRLAAFRPSFAEAIELLP